MTDTTQMLTAAFGLLIAILGLVAWVAKNQRQISRPNDGHSIYDIVTRIESRLDRLERNWDARQNDPRK